MHLNFKGIVDLTLTNSLIEFQNKKANNKNHRYCQQFAFILRHLLRHSDQVHSLLCLLVL